MFNHCIYEFWACPRENRAFCANLMAWLSQHEMGVHEVDGETFAPSWASSSNRRWKFVIAGQVFYSLLLDLSQITVARDMRVDIIARRQGGVWGIMNDYERCSAVQH